MEPRLWNGDEVGMGTLFHVTAEWVCSSLFFLVLQYPWRNISMVFTVFHCVKFSNLDSRDLGLQICIYKQSKSETLLAWSMGWHTSFQRVAEIVATEVLCPKPFGYKILVSKAAAWIWLLRSPLSMLWLRMGLGCNAAQGWDFHY